jgi:hypothetical protein
MHLGTLSPTEDDNKIVDLKQATFQVTPVDTVTPSLTPTSSPEGDAMAGKKLYSLERPDDKARELASKLTLEEQVCIITERMTVTISGLCDIYHICSSLQKPSSLFIKFVQECLAPRSPTPSTRNLRSRFLAIAHFLSTTRSFENPEENCATFLVPTAHNNRSRCLQEQTFGVPKLSPRKAYRQ